MKKIATAMVFLFMMMIGSSTFAETYVPSRTINLVYDDSGSMILLGKTMVDTWCQAKYALEVVTAMLGERDTLNVYYMSDYTKDESAKPRLTLHGSKNANVVAANVEQVHNMVTRASATPFNAVRRAHKDLKKSTADENWLVVLTDGEFRDGQFTSQMVEDYYGEVVADGTIKVMMLSMGPQAAIIHGDESRNIFFEHANSTAAILPKLTKICNRIFQRNALPQIKNMQMSFGVPMEQLIVFAQGKNVQIMGATDASGKEIKPDSNVHARYSTEASIPNPRNILIDKGLNGYIATFDTEFDPGTYKLNVQNAESIDVYYKPNVAISSYLYNELGDEVTSENDIVNGKYKIEFGFVNATTGVKVTDTSLLGKVDYQGTIVNTASDGTVKTINVKSGDMIQIKEGKMDVDVTAKFLEYNTVNTKASYEIFFRNELEFTIDQKPDYHLTSSGLSDADKPIVVTVRMKDEDGVTEFTPEQWAHMAELEIKGDSGLGPFKVVKTAAPGKFEIYPSIGDVDPMNAQFGEMQFSITGKYKQNKSTAEGYTRGSVVIIDSITSFERWMQWIKEHMKEIIGGMIAFFLILGWIVKKRLPRRLKMHPKIIAEGTRPAYPNFDSSGNCTVDLASKLLPYVAETCSYELEMDAYTTVRLSFKAAGNSKMYLLNYGDYDTSENLIFNDKKMSEFPNGGKNYKFGSNFNVTLKSETHTIRCSLNQE